MINISQKQVHRHSTRQHHKKAYLMSLTGFKGHIYSFKHV